MFAPTREESRRFLCEAWRKSRAGEPLTDLERIAALVISQHPEYHALIESPGRALERDFAPEDGGLNPFLHLSLHLAVEEQLAIDQPPGLRARYERLRGQAGSEHEAQHALIECLGETLWHAQRDGTGPDAQRYLDCLDARLR
jgi:hypothetical protein